MEIAAASFPGIYLMGMCSRQERIQKDIDVVIQKSRAEKDCLFAGEFSPFQSLGPSASFLCLPVTPFPSFLAATCVAGDRGWVARSHSRGHLATAAGAGAKRGRGCQPLPFSPPPSGAATSFGGRTLMARAGV